VKKICVFILKEVCLIRISLEIIAMIRARVLRFYFKFFFMRIVPGSILFLQKKVRYDVALIFLQKNCASLNEISKRSGGI